MENVLDSIIDYRGKTPKKSENGIKTLSAKSVRDGYIDYSQCYYISKEEYDRFMVRGFPKVGDVLMTTEAPLGVLARLDRDDIALAQRLITLRGKENVLDTGYLYYYLRSPVGQGKIKERQTGTTVTGIKQAEFRKIEIALPSIDIQRKVASLLGVLDEKILVNKKINDNLLQQASALYKSYFIDMLPFNGIMPSNWHVGTVSEITTLHDSKRIPLSGRERANLAKIYPYYGATSIMDYVDKYLFDGIYLLLGEDGSVIDDKGFPILQYVDGKFWVNNHAHIITGKNGFSVEMLYLLFSLTNVQSIVTGAVQPKISQSNLNKVNVVIPSQEDCIKFDSVVQPFFAQIRNLRTENSKLSELRDSLLPRLMSGEFDVSDIDI